MLKGWFREGRALAHLQSIDRSLARIANVLEEQSSAGSRSGLGLRTFYSDKHSPEEADLLNLSDEDYRDLELLEIQKRKNSGEAQDLSDEEIEGVLSK